MNFDEAFTNPVSRIPYSVPPQIRTAAENICNHFKINGICDPMYIANTIGSTLQIGSGKGTFDRDICIDDDFKLAATRILNSYGCNIGSGDRDTVVSLIAKAC